MPMACAANSALSEVFHKIEAQPSGLMTEYTAYCSMSSSSQTAFLVVTHDMALAQQMDRILRLEDGKLVAA